MENLSIYELSNIHDLKSVICVLKLISRTNCKREIQKKKINSRLVLNSDKTYESLKILDKFGIINIQSRDFISITKYGIKILHEFDCRNSRFNEDEKLKVSSLYRKIPQIKKLLSFYLVHKKGNLEKFNHQTNKRILSVRDSNWIYRHLKKLGIVDYSYYNEIKLTNKGKVLFQTFLIEEALLFYGRDKFEKKLVDSFINFNEIISFINNKKDLFNLFYDEMRTISSLLKKEILLGGIELLEHKDVIEYRRFINEIYEPSKKARVALLLPCAKGKPFSSSRTHKRVAKVLLNLKNYSTEVDEFIISEPIGVIPRKMELIYPAASYDMTLKSWVPLDKVNGKGKIETSTFFTAANKENGDKILANLEKKIVINMIGDEITNFLKEYGEHYDYFIAFLRSTHRKMVENASKRININLIFVPNKEETRKLIDFYGPVSWSLRGMRNEETLKILTNKMNEIIKN